MCGIRSDRTWLALVLVLLPLSLSFSDEIWPSEEPTYTITESELQELETILSRQAMTINALRISLQTSGERIQTLHDTLHRQQTTIDALRISFDEYESATQTRLWRTSAISVVVGIVGGLLVGITAF